MNTLGDYFAPTQLGVGVSGGCEAAVHATRRFIEMMPADYVVAKLDFSNACNNICRDVMLQQVFNQVPEIYKFCCLSYEQLSILRYSSWSISSQEGMQQGDPLGCLLFCLVLQPILSSLTSELRIGYIDDITVGGTLTSVEHDVNFIRNNGLSVELYLNATKCELITTATPAQTSILSKFIIVKPSNKCLIGATLFPGTCLNEMLQHKLEEFEHRSTKLRSIDAHDALLIIKFSLNTSRVMHLLRCFPCCGHPLLKELDNLQRSNICHIANVDLSDVQ